MSEPMYYWDSNTTELPYLVEGAMKEDLLETNHLDPVLLTHDGVVRTIVDEIRERLEFLVTQTDATWTVQELYEVEKMDGTYHVNAIVFHDQMAPLDDPIAEIVEGEY